MFCLLVVVYFINLKLFVLSGFMLFIIIVFLVCWVEVIMVEMIYKENFRFVNGLIYFKLLKGNNFIIFNIFKINVIKIFVLIL